MTQPLENDLANRLHGRRPWPTRVIWLVLLAGLALRPIADDDFWWHLARGRAVWQGTASPSASLLTLDTTREADWFGGVPLFVIHDIAGFGGLMLLRIAAVAGMAFLLMRLTGGLRSAGVAATLAIGLTACLPSFDVTPRMFDVIGLLLVARFALRPASNGDRRWSLLAPLAVLALWANLSVMPIVGWAIFAAARVNAAIGRRAGIRFARSGFKTDSGATGGLSARAVPSDVHTGSKLPVAPVRGFEAASTMRLSLELLLAAGACSLTPRGVFTLWDSLRLAAPRLVADAAVLQERTWRPLVANEWGLAELAFVLLTVVSFWNLLKRPPSLVVCVQVFAAATLGWLNAASVPIAALWLTVAITQIWRAGGVSPPVFVGNRKDRGADAPRSPETIDEVRPPRRWRRHLPGTVLAGWTAIVWLPWPGERPGWGLDPRVDHRLLDATLREVTLDGTAWADDVRSAGMCSWVTRGRIRPHDVPQRALLGGRLRDFVLLRHDLEWNRLSRYRREDDSWGGWWLPLRERRTGLVLVAAEHTRLIRSLEPTIWKPLALDSPVLPYGQAGDPGVSARIVQILKLGSFVEDGAWVSHLLGPSGTDLSLDLWGFAGGVSPNLEQELRQSRVFRARHLPRAGLRVLLPALRVSQTQPLVREFSLCNRDLGQLELKRFGWRSPWRDAVVFAATEESQRSPDGFTRYLWIVPIRLGLVKTLPRWATGEGEPFDWQAAKRAEELSDLVKITARDETWTWPAAFGEAPTCARHGDYDRAIWVLRDFYDGRHRIARALLEWDAGRPTRAREELMALQQSQVKSPKLANWLNRVLEELPNANP